MTAHLSRERLEEIKEFGLARIIKPINDDEILALIDIALAGLDNGYDITASQLREAVHYNPETGKFIRRSNGNPMEHVDGSGYYCFNLFKKSRLAHRMAFYYMTGRLPEKVDHIDGNRLNNEWKNLREATHAENMWNTGMISTNASGVKGVYWHKKLKRWVAEIRTNGKKHYVGSFVDLEEARNAIEERRKELHGEFFNPCSKVENAASPAAVIPEGWEPCSPEWIDRNGPCSCAEAPRIAFGVTGNHYHPHIWHKPAPVAVPDEKSVNPLIVYDGFAEGWNACRAAMLQELKKVQELKRFAGVTKMCRCCTPNLRRNPIAARRKTTSLRRKAQSITVIYQSANAQGARLLPESALN